MAKASCIAELFMAPHPRERGTAARRHVHKNIGGKLASRMRPASFEPNNAIKRAGVAQPVASASVTCAPHRSGQARNRPNSYGTAERMRQETIAADRIYKKSENSRWEALK